MSRLLSAVVAESVWTVDGEREVRHLVWCPGCDRAHYVNVEGSYTWEWDGNAEAPTYSPSLLVKYRHPAGHTNENPAPLGYDGPFVDDVCHSFIVAGAWQFLGDSTHALAGQVVPMVPWPFD